MPRYIQADARFTTDYRENCRINESIQAQAGVENTRVFRKYLQHNAKDIIDNQRAMAQARHKLGCLCSGCSRIHKQ